MAKAQPLTLADLNGAVLDAVQAADLRRQAQIGRQRQAISRLLTDTSGATALNDALVALEAKDSRNVWLEMYLSEKGLGDDFRAWLAEREAALPPRRADLTDDPAEHEEQQ